LTDFRHIEHEHADSFNLLDPAAKFVERGSAHHASRAVHDRDIL